MKHFALALLLACTHASATPPQAAQKYRPILVRQAHVVFGLDAPISVFAAQIEQESGWRAGVTAYDNGRGLAQFMDPTADMISKIYPELGKSDPYNPTWAISALVKYDAWLLERVKGGTFCEKIGAALKGYNAGVGYVQQAQKKSTDALVWFENTEFVTTKQSAKNFEYSRMYPRWILVKRQPNYAGWSAVTCEGLK